MRSSSYIIQSRLQDGKWILVHGYSGAVDVVEPGVVEFLAAASRGDFVPGASSGERFRLCAADVETLTSRCYITNRSEEEEREITSRLAAALHRQNQRHPGIGGVIVPTYDCNLRCRYCYERRLQEHGRAWLGATMTCEKVDAVYAFLESRLRWAGNQRRREPCLPPRNPGPSPSI